MKHLIVVSSFNTDAISELQPSKNLIPEIERVMDDYQRKYLKDEFTSILEKAHKDGINK